MTIFLYVISFIGGCLMGHGIVVKNTSITILGFYFSFSVLMCFLVDMILDKM